MATHVIDLPRTHTRLGRLSACPETKTFVDAKLRDLATEKRRLQRRLEEIEATPFDPIDPDIVLKEGLAAIRDLPRLLETGNPRTARAS